MTLLEQRERAEPDASRNLPEAAQADSPGSHLGGQFRMTFRVAALALGGLHTAAAVQQQAMNEDGINYLDVGAALLAGDWSSAVNPIWSPLYALVIGTAVEAVRPSLWWEFPVVQVVNYIIFGLTLFSFEFFWRELSTRYYKQSAGAPACVRFPPLLWHALGYSLFIWSSLGLIEVWSVTPDMTVAALTYLAGGLLLRTAREDATRLGALWFGMVLGAAYLAKAAMFPLGIVCIVLAGLTRRGAMASPGTLAVAAAGFAIVSSPLVLSLSLLAGAPTFGDAGRFTYLKHVNQLRYPEWGPSLARVSGTPEHPPRRIFDDPDAYEYAQPIAGTYPLALNPGYWTAGLSPKFDARQQFEALASNSARYFDLFAGTQGAFCGLVLLLALLSRGVGSGRNARPEFAIVAWSLVAFALYALVYVESRYIAPFVVLFWSGALGRIQLPDAPAYRRLASLAAAVLIGSVWINIVASNAASAGALVGLSMAPSAEAEFEPESSPHTAAPSASHPAIAEGLLRFGVQRGERLAFIGHTYTAFWARLARVRVVASIEAHHASDFWDASRATQAAVLQRFATAGASAVVAAPPPSADLIPPGWQRIADTAYLFHRLP